MGALFPGKSVDQCASHRAFIKEGYLLVFSSLFLCGKVVCMEKSHKKGEVL